MVPPIDQVRHAVPPQPMHPPRSDGRNITAKNDLASIIQRRLNPEIVEALSRVVESAVDEVTVDQHQLKKGEFPWTRN